MMLLHLTLTSVVISVLCFQVLMVDNLTDSVRFAFHLIGWLVLLLLVCYYSDQLIEEVNRTNLMEIFLIKCNSWFCRVLLFLMKFTMDHGLNLRLMYENIC